MKSTYSHKVFKDFEYEKGFSGKTKHPDYFIFFEGRELIFDVKEFDTTPISRTVVSFDPIPLIQEKINQAQKQFKQFKEWPCSLVLYNKGNPSATIEEPIDMLGSMYGEVGISFFIDPENSKTDYDSFGTSFGPGGKMFRSHWTKPQNTSISALITLRHIQTEKQGDQLGVMVFENVFARNPLPNELFCGDYDIKYGMQGNDVTCIFIGKGLQMFR